jgi:integron integrase
MIQIPPQLLHSYIDFISSNGIQSGELQYYVKWLRYYLDYCHKYNSRHDDGKSLSTFLQKLRDKNQSEQQRKQARHAIVVYGTMLSSTPGKTTSGSTYEHTNHSSFNGPTRNNKLCQENRGVAGKESSAYQGGLRKEYGADWTKLYQDFQNAIKLRHYSPATLKTYTGWTRKFQAFTRSKHPDLLAVEDVKNFLTYLAVDKKVAASSQNQAFNALLFVFRNTLGKEFGKVDGIVRAKRKPYIPVVLSREEVDRIIAALNHPYRLIISLMYGCGLRLAECLSLSVHNLNFDMKILTVHDGKGKKDRTVPLPDTLIEPLKSQLGRVIELHERDCRNGYAGVFLPGRLEKKYPDAARELIWQWFFPARSLTVIPDSKERRRYHVHHSALQKALRTAVQKVQIPKRVTSHTFRHSYASHLLQANYDIRTIQELLGHSDVRTTMIYTHTVKSTTLKEAKSPLDF